MTFNNFKSIDRNKSLQELLYFHFYNINIRNKNLSVVLANKIRRKKYKKKEKENEFEYLFIRMGCLLNAYFSPLLLSGCPL